MSSVQVSAQSSALASLQAFVTVPTSIISYQSNGRVIIIGNADALACCAEFNKPLSPVLIQVAAADDKLIESAVQLAHRSLEIEGHLGQFMVHLVDSQGVREVLQADLILDLSTDASIEHEVPPAGYFHRAINLVNASDIYDELVGMTGEFEKPKYFNYNANICAHGVNGATFCTSCIDACPAGAITSLIDRIEVDPYLCQGGGTCATVCPSGAIQYVYPRLTDNGNQIRKMLQTYREQGGENACVMFYSGDEAPTELIAQHAGLLPVKVEELAAAGMDLCLSSLVYGATQVIYLMNDEVPALSLQKLEHQLSWLSAILAGLDLDPHRVSIHRPQDEFRLIISKWRIEPAIYSMPDIKRNVF
jgi:ferredoxin